MKKVINTFEGGVNRDLSFHDVNSNKAYNLKNVELIAQDEGESAVVVNSKGTTTIGDISAPDPSTNIIEISDDYDIVGTCNIGDDIILFARKIADTTKGRLYIITYDNTLGGYRVKIALTNELDFNFGDKVEAKGIYESEHTWKVYWADGVNPLRYANVAPDLDTDGSVKSKYSSSSYTRIQGQTLEEFEMLSTFGNLSQIEFEEYVGGNLMSGVVQYTYRMYKDSGSYSSIAPASELIPITKNGEGLPPNENSGTGVKFSVSTLNTTLYDYIEVIKIHYEQLNGSPTIKVVGRYELETDMTFVDDGNGYIDSYTYEELLTLSPYFIPNAIEVKNNTLFCGGITEDVFDVDEVNGSYWDARAYGFNSSQQAKVYNNGVLKTINSSFQIDGADIGEQEDLRCTYNILSDDYTGIISGSKGHALPCKYKLDGTVGGEGINISYEFENISAVSIDDIKDNVQVNVNLSQVGFKEWNRGSYRLYQRDEIYRFGIVFYDDKGRHSYVKWIGDIRMPDDGDLTFEAAGSCRFIGKVIKFTVNNIPQINGNDLDYRIVRVPRESGDRTIRASGKIGCLYSGGDNMRCFYGGLTSPTVTSENIYGGATFDSRTTNKLLQFDSPEISFNRNYSYVENDYLEVTHELERDVSNRYNDSITRDIISGTVVDITNAFAYYSASSITTYKLDIRDGKIVIGSYFNNTVLDSSIDDSISNRVFSGDYFGYSNSTYSFGLKGTCLVLSTDDTLTNSLEEKVLYARIRRDITQYGGYTYEDRQKNTYIPATTVNGNYSYYGDTFINMFSYHRSMCYDFSAEERQLFIAEKFPTETSINTTYRYDDHVGSLGYSSNNSRDERSLRAFMQEQDNTIINGEVTNWSNLYLYNTVYSIQDKSRFYFPKPQNFKKNREFPYTIRYSDVKVNGEEIDRGLIFRQNNYIDLNSEHGWINNIVEYKNHLIVFQETGFCLIPVNEYRYEQTDGGNTVAISSGEPLGKPNYEVGSTKVGNQNRNDVIKSLSNLYWIDVNKRKVYGYNGVTMSLTDIKGLSTYFRDNIDKSSTMIGMYDNKYSKVLFTYSKQDDSKETIGFSEILEQFTGWYSFVPDIYIQSEFDLTTMAKLSDNKNYIHQHNVGNRGEFYGVTYDSIVELIINPDSGSEKQFNFISWISDVQDSNGNDKPISTFESISASNSYKSYTDTGAISIVPFENNIRYLPYSGGVATTLSAPLFNARRKNRLWTMTFPRIESSVGFNYRFRDVYSKVKFIFSNIDNYTLKLYKIITGYQNLI